MSGTRFGVRSVRHAATLFTKIAGIIISKASPLTRRSLSPMERDRFRICAANDCAANAEEFIATPGFCGRTAVDPSQCITNYFILQRLLKGAPASCLQTHSYLDPIKSN